MLKLNHKRYVFNKPWLGGDTMYHFHDVQSGFVQMQYWCGSQLWRGRIKIVSVGAYAGHVECGLMRFCCLLVHEIFSKERGFCYEKILTFIYGIYVSYEVAIMKKSNRKLLLKIITSCLIVILFILYFINVFNILVFVSLIAIVLVSFWILLKFIEINEERWT